jgi:hypothetical protein
MPRRVPKKTPDPSDSKATGNPVSDHAAGPGSGGQPEPSSRPGPSPPESIVSETEFTSPKGAKYRIIKTRETDPYDKPEKPKGSQKRKKG